MESRIDERALGAGTTVRFALLATLLVATSSMMVIYVSMALFTYDGMGCSLAAGVAHSDPASAVIAKRGLQWEAYFACTKRYAPLPPWWVLAGWWSILALSTAALFRALPAWKARRSRVVPLATVDPDGEIAGDPSRDAPGPAGLGRGGRVRRSDSGARAPAAGRFDRRGRRHTAQLRGHCRVARWRWMRARTGHRRGAVRLEFRSGEATVRHHPRSCLPVHDVGGGRGRPPQGGYR